MTKPGEQRSDLQPVGWQAASLAVASAVLWAGQSLAVKLALVDVAPFVSMACRCGLAILVLGGWAAVSRVSLAVGRRAMGLVALNSLLLFIQIALFTVGTDRTSSVLSILLINTFPFFAAVFAHWLVPAAQLTARKLTGLALAFLGLLVTFGEPLLLPTTRAAEPAGLVGGWLVLAAAGVVGLKIAFMKRVLQEMPPQTMVFWDTVLATPLFVLAALVAGEPWPAKLSTGAAAALAYQGLAVSGGAFIVWTYLLSRHNPNDLTAFRLLTAPLGMLLGWLWLGEPLSATALTGGALIVLGIYRVTS